MDATDYIRQDDRDLLYREATARWTHSGSEYEVAALSVTAQQWAANRWLPVILNVTDKTTVVWRRSIVLMKPYLQVSFERDDGIAISLDGTLAARHYYYPAQPPDMITTVVYNVTWNAAPDVPMEIRISFPQGENS